jgi:hypothetical protein
MAERASINIYLTPEQKDHLIQRARARNLSPSGLVRWLIDVEVEQEKTEFPMHEWVGERKARELRRPAQVTEEPAPLDDGSCPWCGPEGIEP